MTPVRVANASPDRRETAPSVWRVKVLPVVSICVAVMAIDRWTKILARGAFAEGELREVIPGLFDLTLRYNTGAAFSLFDSSPVLFFLGVSGLAIAALISFLVQLGPKDRTQIWALGAVMGGALGNLWDRLVIGGVVDFLLFHYRSFAWPAFNVADIAIVVGVIVFLIENLRAGRGAEAR